MPYSDADLALTEALECDPEVMRERIRAKGWHWDLAHSPLAWTWRDGKKVALDLVERLTGVRLFEYRSYRRIR